MSKILIVTVGGSCQPIVTAINRNKPDKIYFICSDDQEKTKGSYNTVNGEGLVCGPLQKPDKLNIITQCDLSGEEQFEIIKMVDMDNYNYCYSECYNLILRLQTEQPNYQIIIDFTGGTKSMSGGLLLAATEFPDIIVSVVKGERHDLLKVKDGTERVSKTRVNLRHLNDQLKQIQKFIELYDFGSALELAKESLNVPDLDKNYERKFLKLKDYCTCLNLWDIFNHEQAYLIAKEKKCIPEEFMKQLQNVLNSRRCLEENTKIPPDKKFSRYEVVFDLIKNAERKAIQKKYDDAVGRLYRATELLAQVYLKFEYNIDTGKIPLSKLPENLRDNYKNKIQKNGELKLALIESYDLIYNLNNEATISRIFAKERKKIMNGLTARNESILAHGFSPVDESQYKEVSTVLISNFVSPILKYLTKNIEMVFLQFPQNYAPQSL